MCAVLTTLPRSLVPCPPYAHTYKAGEGAARKAGAFGEIERENIRNRDLQVGECCLSPASVCHCPEGGGVCHCHRTFETRKTRSRACTPAGTHAPNPTPDPDPAYRCWRHIAEHRRPHPQLRRGTHSAQRALQLARAGNVVYRKCICM